MEQQNYWRSKAYYIYAESFDSLCTQLNEFAKDKFVIAWQIFTNTNFHEIYAVITYKVKE